MTCQRCGRHSEPCPYTGYDADELCRECQQQADDDPPTADEDDAAYWRHMHAKIDEALGK